METEIFSIKFVLALVLCVDALLAVLFVGFLAAPGVAWLWRRRAGVCVVLLGAALAVAQALIAVYVDERILIALTVVLIVECERRRRCWAAEAAPPARVVGGR